MSFCVNLILVFYPLLARKRQESNLQLAERGFGKGEEEIDETIKRQQFITGEG